MRNIHNIPQTFQVLPRLSAQCALIMYVSLTFHIVYDYLSHVYTCERFTSTFGKSWGSMRNIHNIPQIFHVLPRLFAQCALIMYVSLSFHIVYDYLSHVYTCERLPSTLGNTWGEYDMNKPQGAPVSLVSVYLLGKREQDRG